MAPLILLVDKDTDARRWTDALLSEEGYLVVTTSSFVDAKQLLYSIHPDLLVAGVRLGAFNGLHLAVRCRMDYPDLPVIITHSSPDAVLEAEAKRQGAAFVVNPPENPEFLKHVRAALGRRARQNRPIRRWQRKRVSGVVEAQVAAASARICDMSYRGVRLAFGDVKELPGMFDITVPTAGVSVQARPVWTFRSPATDEFWCGAELVDSGTTGLTQWRDFVDSTR